MLPSFKKLNLAEFETSRLQDNVDAAFKSVLSCQLLDGLMLTGVSLSTIAATVNHKLGRTPVGYLVVSKNANAVVYNGAFTETTISLTASASCSVNLWIF